MLSYVWLAIFMWLEAAVLLGWGALVGERFFRWQGVSAFALFSLGIGFAFLIAALCNLLFPVSTLVSAAFYVGGVAAFVKERNTILAKFPEWRWVLLLFLLLFVAAAVGRPTVDSGGYQLQAILWKILEPSAFGLAKLHSRFGFNSIWITASAAMALGPKGLVPIFSLMASAVFIFLVTTVKQFTEARDSLARAFLFSLFFFCLVISKTMFHENLGSTSTDLPAALFTLSALVEAIFYWREGAADNNLLMLGIFVLLSITTKVSQAPVALLLWLLRKKPRLLTKRVFVFISAILVLWALQGFISSGCIAFPVAVTCLVRPSWGFPYEYVQHVATELTLFAREQNFVNNSGLGAGTQTHWALALLSRSFLQVLLFTFFLSLFFIVLRKTARQGFSGIALQLGLAFLACAVGIIFWFCLGPDIRFGYAFLLGFILLFLAIALGLGVSPLWKQAQTNALLWGAFGFGVLRVALVALAVLHSQPSGFFTHWPHLPELHYRESVNVGGQSLFSPLVGGDCWDFPLPCEQRPDLRVYYYRERGHWLRFELLPTPLTLEAAQWSQ